MLGLSLNGQASGSSAVVIEDYLWSSVTAGEITPRFSNLITTRVQDFNDAWDLGVVTDHLAGGDPGGGMFGEASANEMMPATDPNPNYFSDDEGYWVVTEANNLVMTDAEDMLVGQDADSDTELTPIAVGNFPIGDGNYGL